MADYDAFAGELAFLQTGLYTGALIGFRLQECVGCAFGAVPVAPAGIADVFTLRLLPPAGGSVIVRGPYPVVDFLLPQLPELRGELNAGAITGFEFGRGDWPAATAPEPGYWPALLLLLLLLLRGPRVTL